MGFFGRGVEVGTKEAMVPVGALRSCGSLGFAAAEALMVFFWFFGFFKERKRERRKRERKKKEERKKRWNQSVLTESTVLESIGDRYKTVVDGVNSTSAGTVQYRVNSYLSEIDITVVDGVNSTITGTVQYRRVNSLLE
jgi:hypothetical protein